MSSDHVISFEIQMQQGRRTASLKASYEAVSKNVDLTKELTLGRELSINKLQLLRRWIRCQQSRLEVVKSMMIILVETIFDHYR